MAILGGDGGGRGRSNLLERASTNIIVSYTPQQEQFRVFTCLSHMINERSSAEKVAIICHQLSSFCNRTHSFGYEEDWCLVYCTTRIWRFLSFFFSIGKPFFLMEELKFILSRGVEVAHTSGLRLHDAKVPLENLFFFRLASLLAHRVVPTQKVMLLMKLLLYFQ